MTALKNPRMTATSASQADAGVSRAGAEPYAGSRALRSPLPRRPGGGELKSRMRFGADGRDIMTDDQAMGGETSIGADQEMGGGDTDDQAIVGIDPDLSSDDLSGDETAEHGTEGV